MLTPCGGVQGWFHPVWLDKMLTVYLTVMLRWPVSAALKTQAAMGAVEVELMHC